MSKCPPKQRDKRQLQLHPKELAASLRASIESDLRPMVLHSEDRRSQETLARWGKPLGLDAELGVPKGLHLDWEQRADLVAQRISPHPARFDELADQTKAFEERLLRKEAHQLESCGTPWGRVVRIFWRDRKGHIVSRERGLHSCKHRWCPHCGRARQNRLVNQMEGILELSREWGFSEQNMRFLTLTIPNGEDIPSLRKKAHEAWARLQRTRTWPREVFGWFRGTEVVTGSDGKWNLHLHVVVMLWAHQVSYQSLWKTWAAAVGERCQVDVQTLADYRRKARAQGTSRAARYIVKYLTKLEALADLSKGPGGFAHLMGATRHFRTFAMGGGCSLLRRMLPILLPSWARRAERALAGAELRDGRPPIWAEEVNPETGEVFDIPPPVPFPDPHEHAAWTTLAARLADDEGTVGIRCGPEGRFRRIGSVPLPSRGPTVEQWVKVHRASVRTAQSPRLSTKLRWVGRGTSRRPVPAGVSVCSGPLRVDRSDLLNGFRAVIGGVVGWRLFTIEDTVKVYERDTAGTRKATGETRVRTFRAILPKGRFAWKRVATVIWSALLGDTSPWGQLRRAAFRAWADGKVEPFARENHLRALGAALDDRVTQTFEERMTRTTRRALHSADLMRAFVQAVQRDSKAVWDQAVIRLWNHAEALTRNGLLAQCREGLQVKELRGDLEAECGF